MRRLSTLNPQLSRVISETGHVDTVVVTDAGLPLPQGVERVDLAFRPGQPAFLDVLDTVLESLSVEGAIVASEVVEASPEMYDAIRGRLGERGVSLQMVPHVEFKELTKSARACVRSGEFTPYANIILVAGVVYGAAAAK
ncbi:MAG TPA: D-ribose pyranase, partial [Propionicimonas sp.]|jgi:D-ribose pyranase